MNVHLEKDITSPPPLHKKREKQLPFKDRRDGKHMGGGYLAVALLDRMKQVVRRIVHAGDDLATSLRVGTPHYNDFVHAVDLFKVSEVISQLVEMGLLVASRQHVIGTGALVRGNPVGVVDGWTRNHLLHMRTQLALQIVVEHLQKRRKRKKLEKIETGKRKCTLARSMASARFMELMSHPKTSMSDGFTIGNRFPRGT